MLQRLFTHWRVPLTLTLDDDVILSFSPGDQKSIDTAITEIETVIDIRAAVHPDNPWIARLAGELKAEFRAAILDRAAQGF